MQIWLDYYYIARKNSRNKLIPSNTYVFKTDKNDSTVYLFICSSSAYHSAPKGSDYVDYGAYTGKHGAFGWYSDHPVLLFGHHH